MVVILIPWKCCLILVEDVTVGNCMVVIVIPWEMLLDFGGRCYCRKLHGCHTDTMEMLLDFGGRCYCRKLHGCHSDTMEMLLDFGGRCIKTNGILCNDCKKF